MQGSTLAKVKTIVRAKAAVRPEITAAKARTPAKVRAVARRQQTAAAKARTGVKPAKALSGIIGLITSFRRVSPRRVTDQLAVRCCLEPLAVDPNRSLLLRSFRPPRMKNGITQAKVRLHKRLGYVSKALRPAAALRVGVLTAPSHLSPLTSHLSPLTACRSPLTTTG